MPTKIRLIIAGICFAFVCLRGAPAPGPAATQVEGSLELVSATNRELPVLKQANFRIVTDGVRYRMFIQYTRLPAKGPRSREFTFDGRDTYEVIEWPPELINGTNSNPRHAHAYARSHPSDVNFFDLAPWFAFCSHEYLRSITNDQVWGFLHFAKKGEAPMKLKVQRAHDSVTGFLTNMNVYDTAVRLPRGKAFTNDAAPLLVAQLTSESLGEFRGGTAPNLMRLTSLIHPRYNQVKMTVTNYAAGEVLASWVPALAEATTISDRRFPKPGPVVYASHQGGWLDRDDPQLRFKINSLLHGPVHPAAPVSWFRMLCIVILMLTPVLVVARKSMKQKQDKQNQKGRSA